MSTSTESEREGKSHWNALASTLCGVLLVGVAASLLYKDLRRRTLQTEELRERKRELEREVEQQTRELVALSTHLQSVAEREKAALARELHDELGGLLVGARMDISWAEQHLPTGDNDMRQRLNRVQQNLSAGIDLKRRIIEELRPTLLDNVGFVAALRWQFKETLARTDLKCTEYFPDEEPRFTAEAAIALFRIAQEAFINIAKHSGAKEAHVSLDIDEDTVVFRITDDGRGIPQGSFSASGSHGLASMRHRVRALEGTFDVSSFPSGGTSLIVRIPVSKALRPAPETELL
jgi:signal transduction histidine kinase